MFSEMILAEKYILQLHNAEGHLIINRGREMGFVGFLICNESLILM